MSSSSIQSISVHSNSIHSNTDISVNIAGLKFQNPVIAASGTFGYGTEYSGILDVSRLGGIVSKGLTLKPRQGNSGMRLWETPSGLLNSIGLENPGIEHFIENELPQMLAIGHGRQHRPLIIANLSGSTVEEYSDGAKLLSCSAIDAIELNISCPNVKAGGMAFGLEPSQAALVTESVKNAASNKPLIVKLSPNAADINAVALAAIKAGADALSLVNTFKAMAIDIHTGKPVFDNISAGLSGPCIKAIALRIVWELCRFLEDHNCDTPVIGMGGITSCNDALEFLIAGAKAVQVGSATFSHPQTMIEIIDGLKEHNNSCYARSIK
ncbi:MAG: dihydroorotate dehydrogenase [Spirochaetaceae bacterium]|jgi:dihydroorotate dehydrogenase (NAD+) catalytic subunit|nr:dihydroorotate dehydrogenase [Spirochaetaceae bacterium]